MRTRGQSERSLRVKERARQGHLERFKASHPGRVIKRYRASKPAVLPKVIGKVIRQGQGRSTTIKVEIDEH